MIPQLLAGTALLKAVGHLFDDNTPRRRKLAEPESNHHPLLVAAGVAVAAGLLTRAIVHRRRHYDLRGRVVLLTGATRGLGLEIARQLAGRGARLAICARSEAELREAQDDLHHRGADVFAGVCDVTRPEQIRTFVGQVRDQMGTVDVLINNAGTITVGPVQNMTLRDFETAMDTHFNGPLHFILEVAGAMRRRGSGRICNIASFGGRVAIPHLTPYSASKFALVGLGEGLRTELVKDGVYVTTVCPGEIRTGSTHAAEFKGRQEEEFQWFAGGAFTPVVSIGPGRMAAKVIAAIEHGDAEVIAPFVTKLQTMFHGMAPGVGVELLTLLDRLLPAPVPGDTSSSKGREADVGQLPAYTAEMQEQAIEAYNQNG